MTERRRHCGYVVFVPMRTPILRLSVHFRPLWLGLSLLVFPPRHEPADHCRPQDDQILSDSHKAHGRSNLLMEGRARRQ